MASMKEMAMVAAPIILVLGVAFNWSLKRKRGASRMKRRARKLEPRLAVPGAVTVVGR